MSDQTSTKTPSEISSLVVRSHIYRFIASSLRRPDLNKTDFKKENMDQDEFEKIVGKKTKSSE